MGRLQCKNNHYCVKFTRIVSVEKEDVLMQQLERFWKPDNAGLVPDCKVSIFIENSCLSCHTNLVSFVIFPSFLPVLFAFCLVSCFVYLAFYEHLCSANR